VLAGVREKKGVLDDLTEGSKVSRPVPWSNRRCGQPLRTCAGGGQNEVKVKANVKARSKSKRGRGGQSGHKSAGTVCADRDRELRKERNKEQQGRDLGQKHCTVKSKAQHVSGGQPASVHPFPICFPGQNKTWAVGGQSKQQAESVKSRSNAPLCADDIRVL